MADTSQHELSEPHTNGAVDGLTEEEKSKMRPADIDADMREMERRKRVEMMMNSRLFREELERIIETQMKDGGAGPSGLLQQISDMMGAQGARFNSNVFKSSNCVVPINDIRGVESMGYAKGEKLLRCKLAAVFRLLDLYGWTQGVGGHITARLNQDQEHFLVNPYGLLYHEVTASSLVKVDMQGSVVEQGTTNFGVHVTSFQLHSTIHASRPDIKCIIHITTPSVIAVSSLKCGLLPLGHESIVIGEASTHQYIGGVFEPEEKEKISRNLGPVNKIMFLTNRGALCCGETVEEAFYNVYNTVLACETQLKLMPVGIDNLTLISEESRKAIFDASRRPPVPQQASVAEPSPLADKLEKRWRIGGTEFEALMRMLDNAGFRTGYIYRHPLVKGEPPRPRNDVEVPPAVSSLGYLLEEEELYKQGLWKGGRKGTDRSRWLNSPNVYQKVEILETGTPDPKKITKWVDQNAEEWVTDGSPTHSSTPVKIESALQFVPKNTNPKEFKQLQQQIKDYRRADKISAGPQSHILEGVTWDEAKKMQDATISATGEQVVLVGAASKGIIQRGFQHNAMVYKTPYAKNPFDAITDQELDQYKKDVERKQKGDPYDESQSESEALSSFNVSRATHESSTAKSPIQSPVSVTSETEEESRDEPRVLRIETKQVPLPSQPEVVLSDVHEHAMTVSDDAEPTAAAVVLDSPVVQQALIQQARQQSQNIIHQKPAVDATSEFLNEMRRTAVDPRNDLNRRDCQSSNSGSFSSGNSCGWPPEPYETIRLEVARSRMVAPRMTPMITQIVHSKLTNKIEPTNSKTKQPPPVPPKPKPYVALRNAFLKDFITKPAPASRANRFRLNSNSNVAPNHIEILDYNVDRTQVAGVSQLLNISVKNGDLGRETSANQNVGVSMDILKESNDSKVDCNDFETVFRRKNDAPLHKPLIVGAILKNINDLHTLCLGSDMKSSICKSDVNAENNSDQFEKNVFNRSDENGNFSNAANDAHKDEEVPDLGSNNCVNDYNSISTSEELVDESLDRKEEILTQKTLTDCINNDLEEESCTQVDPTPCSESELKTPRRNRTYVRIDSLTEVINSVKVNLTPTKMLLSVLPESNISSKYNLDSTNMSLIYSLTPTNDDTEQDQRFSRNTSLDMSGESLGNVEFKRLDSCETENSVHDEDSEFIWVDLMNTNGNKKDKDDNTASNQTIDLFDTSIESLDNGENFSDQGSDILELPYSTVQELRETDGESFNRDIKTVANEIIAELGDIELYTQASNFIDEILYDISCLKLEENHDDHDLSVVVQDKLHALCIAKEIANTLISNLPCYEKESAPVLTEKNDGSAVSNGFDNSDDVIVIDEIVHHVVHKLESTKNSSASSPDSFNLKKVKESANTELKEMQNSFKSQIQEVSCLDNADLNLSGENKSSEMNSEREKIDADTQVEVITVIDIDEELNLVQEVETEAIYNLQTSVDELFTSETRENSSEVSLDRFHSSDERLFITLDSYSPSNYSRVVASDVSENLDASRDLEHEQSKVEEENDRGECYSSCKSCQSPLDCDECSFFSYKTYRPIEDDDEDEEDGLYRSYAENTVNVSSQENTESDLTDHDTLGEAILQFCTIAKPSFTAECMELNFSVERRLGSDEAAFFNENSGKKEEAISKLAECTQCRCCVAVTPLDFVSAGQLPPISEEEASEPIEKAGQNSPIVKLEREFDCLDSLSDSDVLIAAWFDNSSTSGKNKLCQTSPNQSAVSLESTNTVDYYSCRDDSHSTAFQSAQNTTENSENVEKSYDSDVEVIYVADKDDKKLDRTYTLSDASVNSLDTISSIESDGQKRSKKSFDVTYSADVSTNADETVFRSKKSVGQMSSSSSETRMSSEENCFDTTMNMADVSGHFTPSKLRQEVGSLGDESALAIRGNRPEAQDCMTYSYDTREFMKLEEALAEKNERGVEIDDCTCSQAKCGQKICNRESLGACELSPIDPPPRYEDTTLYRVVSQINLTDILNDVPESLRS